MNRTERLSRLFRVLAAIVAEPGLNPLELAERVGTSERTLRRDLAELREMGYDVAYTSGYEVQEKLDLEGGRRGRSRTPMAEKQLELLHAVAEAVGAADLWKGLDQPEPGQAPRRRTAPRKPKAGASMPTLLIAGGGPDAEFVYGTGFEVEGGVYIRFPDGDDVLAVNGLEIDRARAQASAARTLDRPTVRSGDYGGCARVAADLLREKGFGHARVSPRLQAGYLEALRVEGIEVEIDESLFMDERRRKSAKEADAIQESQRAAEAAVVAAVRELARAEIRDGILWLEGSPLTSERLYARAQLALGELGFTCPDMIIAGSPGSAMPHYRGEGPIAANAPVILDIFPSSRATHYFGDLTRTVVVGEVSEEVRKMHAAVLQALEAGVEAIAEGVPGRDVNATVCQVLVDRGYGASTVGFEPPPGVAFMNHSTGHGVGLDVHEKPELRGPSKDVLREGDVVTVEPGLYRLELGGVRIEDTGMVTKTGFRNFTTLTRSLDPRDYV